MSELLQSGGWVLVAIAVASCLVWSLLAASFFELFRVSRNQGLVRRLGELSESTRVPRRELVPRVLRPWLDLEAAALRRHLDLIGTLAMTLPLMGLLGTVLGMVVTFEALTLRGTAEVDRFADGISQALLTTQAGLVCALPALVARGYLRSRIRRVLGHADLRLHQMEQVLRDGGGP